MTKTRLDKLLVARGLADSRSQAENYIRLGDVSVGGRVIQKPGLMVDAASADVQLRQRERCVSRAGLKLASVTKALSVQFKDAVVLDVGSSTGGFTDYALKHGAQKIYAVDVGTDQMHPRLRSDQRVELHEKTDIRQFTPQRTPDLVLIDVSFISVRHILPHIARLCDQNTRVVVMVKPQFEAERSQVNKGLVKNDTVRRRILAAFETWVMQYFVIIEKRDSRVAGSKGNVERFYMLRLAAHAEAVN